MSFRFQVHIPLDPKRNNGKMKVFLSPGNMGCSKLQLSPKNEGNVGSHGLSLYTYFCNFTGTLAVYEALAVYDSEMPP